MSRTAGTRSGMLWQVERLLSECAELPQLLVMENVPDVIGIKNKNDFYDWQLKLEQLGYKNYVKVLNSKDFNIPQHRERCFMVSILGDYNFNFPKEIKLNTPLSEILQINVDKKLYISANEIKEIFNPVATEEITLKQVIQLEGKFESIGRVYSIDGLAPTINMCGGGNREPKIFDTTIYLKSKNKRLKSLVEKTNFKENETLFLDAYNQKTINNLAATITTRVDASNATFIFNKGIIRKLSSNECWRLMGVKDADYSNVAANQSNSSLYHLAGDSIVTTVLMAILGQLLDIDWQTKFNPEEWWKNE